MCIRDSTPCMQYGCDVIGCVVHVEFGRFARTRLPMSAQVDQHLPHTAAAQRVDLEAEFLSADVESMRVHDGYRSWVFWPHFIPLHTHVSRFTGIDNASAIGVQTYHAAQHIMGA